MKNNIDRYFKITKWLKQRYAVNGMIVTIQNGEESIYCRLERMAFIKYITCV